MKVFVTGNQGYIGAHLVELLKRGGHYVIGCDRGFYLPYAWAPAVPPDVQLIKDIRELTAADLKGCDCVMHLAAISNDPMGELDLQLTYSVNREATGRLAQVAKEAGVSRFLFASSCSIYGKHGEVPVDEQVALEPLTAYSHSKVAAETRLAELADEHFTCVALRCATVFGASPQLRLDLVANNLLAAAFVYGEIRIMSDGTPWRPIVHCRDCARAFVEFSTAPMPAPWIAVNAGFNALNYQVREIAEAVQRVIPSAKVVYTGQVGPDARSYRVNFDRLQQLLPGFTPEYSLDRGLQELYAQFEQRPLIEADLSGQRFNRLAALKQQLGVAK